MIVPGDPPCPEPKAAVNRALFSITPVRPLRRGLALQKTGWNLSLVLSDPCYEPYSRPSQICSSTLEVQMWMTRLTERKFDLRSPELRANIQSYSDLSVMEMKKDQVRWQVVLNGLDQLKAVGQTVATAPAQ